MFNDEALVMVLESSECQISSVLLEVILVERPDLVFRKSPMGYPLHLACAQNLSRSVVEMLVVAFPDAVISNANEWWPATPLFLACSNLVPNMEVIQYLVSKDSPSCLVGTTDRPPLYHFCLSIWRHPVDVSRKLTSWVLSKYPGAATIADFRGRFPIHHAVSVSDTERFHVLLRAHDGDLLDGEGSHLLHLAVADSHRVTNNLLTILEERPEALSLINVRGELPVHVSIKKVDRNLLLQLFPFAMLYTTKDGQTVLGNCRRELERCIRIYYPVEEDEGDADDEETLDGWERPSVSWIFPTEPSTLAEMDHLFCILNSQVVPLLRQIVVQSWLAITGNNLPPEVANEILLFAVPHYEEAICHTPCSSEPR
jgi:hypothetical protein